MIRSMSLGYITSVVLLLLQYVLHYSLANEKERFTYSYMDNDNNILKLGCHGDCSTDHHLASILIYNVKKMEKMAVVNPAKAPVTLISAQEEMSYYVAGLLEKESCHLELLITNVKLLTLSEVACNLTRVDETGTVIIKSLQTSIGTTAAQKSLESRSSTTLTVLIVVAGVLFLSTIIFFYMWLRDRSRYRKEIAHDQIQGGDNVSESFKKSPSRLSVRDTSNWKLPATNGSIYRLNSRSDSNFTVHKVGHLPPPTEPPPKMQWENRSRYTKQASAYSTCKLAYSVPQDTIEPDLSEDGDVTSGNSDNQHGYSQSSGEADSKTSVPVYSSIPFKITDVCTLDATS